MRRRSWLLAATVVVACRSAPPVRVDAPERPVPATAAPRETPPVVLSPGSVVVRSDGVDVLVSADLGALLDATAKATLSKGGSVDVDVHVELHGGGRAPLATSRTGCTIRYELWNEVFRITDPSGPRPPERDFAGVRRRCFELHDLALASRSALAPGRRYRVTVVAEIDANGARRVHVLEGAPFAP